MLDVAHGGGVSDVVCEVGVSAGGGEGVDTLGEGGYRGGVACSEMS